MIMAGRLRRALSAIVRIGVKISTAMMIEAARPVRKDDLSVGGEDKGQSLQQKKAYDRTRKERLAIFASL